MLFRDHQLNLLYVLLTNQNVRHKVPDLGPECQGLLRLVLDAVEVTLEGRQHEGSFGAGHHPLGLGSEHMDAVLLNLEPYLAPGVPLTPALDLLHLVDDLEEPAPLLVIVREGNLYILALHSKIYKQGQVFSIPSYYHVQLQDQYLLQRVFLMG